MLFIKYLLYYKKAIKLNERHETMRQTSVCLLNALNILKRFFFFLDSNFVLGNAQVPCYPIVYCSDGFCELTGWTRAHIMQKGCACKFLHGPDTREEHRHEIDTALDSKHELKLELIFYKKNGNYFLPAKVTRKEYFVKAFP